MPLKPPNESVVDRFIRYAKMDTQSREGEGNVPSTECQWALLKLLADELKALGADNVRVNEHGIVCASLPATAGVDASVPTIGFIAHVDTAPAVTGTNVHPVVHHNYQGGDIPLPKDPHQVLTVAQNPALEDMVGDDIITTDGTTLLGSDDKAGVAAIMALVDTLRQNPAVRHGPLAVAFNPDEEVGTGIKYLDVDDFGAQFAYTIDGGPLGEISDETWSARLATVTFQGKNTHPGTAKGVMVNAMYAMAHYLLALPRELLPEATEGREGFVHPYIGTADVEQSSLRVLLRDFEVPGLERQERLLRELATATEEQFAGITIDIKVEENYRNMKEVLRDHPQLVENAFEAARRAGVEPFLLAVRGGTDGSKLTFRGLPCPNIFTGGHNFHSKLEFNSRRGLEKTAETLVHLVQVFAERAASR